MRYDTDRWAFAEQMRAALGIASWDDLPAGDPADPAAAVELNRHYRRTLAQLPLEHPLRRMYREFVVAEIAPLFGGHVSYTETAVLRVQVAHSPSISALHRDVDYTGRWDYINAWVPLVDVPVELGLRVESSFDAPTVWTQGMTYGELLLFDGTALRHFSPANDADRPRVSMDFRFAPREPSALAARIRSARPAGIEQDYRLPASAGAKAP